MTKSVFALLVTYNSDINRLSAALVVLSKQCPIIVIDNSDSALCRDKINILCHSHQVNYFSLGENVGIAKAQNLGVEIAKKYGATDILLMDDDSIPNNSFIEDMLRERQACRLSAVVGSARVIGEDGTDVSNSSALGAFGFTKCDELTSSGALIPMNILELVGPFDEKLFIDCVDFEWGWRANALGISLVLFDHVSIQHRLGINKFLGFKIPSPIRHYYQYRNILHLIFNSKAPLRWRFLQLFKLPIKIILILFLTDLPFVRLRYALYGVFDFIIGRFGKFDH